MPGGRTQRRQRSAAAAQSTTASGPQQGPVTQPRGNAASGQMIGPQCVAEGGQTAWGGAMAAQAGGQQVALPEGFSEEQLAAAQTWASSAEGPSANVVRQLQAQLGVAQTGRYDRATVVAVVNDQRAASQASTGRADVAYMRAKGLIFTREVTDVPVDDALLADLQQNNPDGFTVSIYADYQENTGNAREFVNQAGVYAQNSGAIGVQGGSLARGVAIGVDSPAAAIESMRQVHQSLQSRWLQALPAYVRNIVTSLNATGRDGTGPGWTKAQDVGLFAHGIPNAVNLNDDEYNYSAGLNADSYGTSNIDSFVDGIRGATTNDVDVQVFACSAARGVDESEAWLEHRQDVRMGEQSIAQELSDALGPEASVYSHTTAGHTTENYAARVFGADAGGGRGGLHTFDLLFPETYIQSELERIYPNSSAEQRQTRHDALRDEMWNRYRRSIGPGKTIPGGTEPTGQMMFRDPDGAGALLQADWEANNAPRN